MPTKVGAPVITPRELWQMSSGDFNAWRKTNDYPRIIEYFKSHLQGFNDWLSGFHINENELINHGIANFLVREELHLLSRSNTDLKCIAKIETSPGDAATIVSINKLKSGDRYTSMFGTDCHVLECRFFQPYLHWAKSNRIKIHPQSIDGRIKVTTIEGTLSPEHCRTYVFGELELLKMGGLDLHNSLSLSQKDLAFVNLDFITFGSDSIGSSYSKQVMFSSARNWRFTNSDETFFEFLDTNLENLQISNCKLYGWRWYRCEGSDSLIRDSELTNCTFGLGSFIPYFDNVDLTDSELEPEYEKGEDFGFLPSKELARRMKTCFVNRGQHSKAGKYFFIEKSLERREFLKDGKRNVTVFLSPNHMIKTIATLWRSRSETKITIKSLIWTIWALLKEGRKNKRNWHNLSYSLINYLKFLSSVLQSLWWGYGERPSRVLLASLLILLACSGLIHLSYGIDSGKTIADSLWYSFVSFITLGDPDFKPIGWSRLIVAAEGMTGILAFGFLISGLAGKSRY